MSNKPKPSDPKKPGKGKKLVLKKEAVQELSQQELDQVAGGARTGGDRCAAQTLAPACPPEPIDTVGCAPNPDPPTIYTPGNCTPPVTD